MREFILLHFVMNSDRECGKTLDIRQHIICTSKIEHIEEENKHFGYEDLSEEEKKKVQGLVTETEIGGSFIVFRDKFGKLQHNWTLETPAAIYKRIYGDEFK